MVKVNFREIIFRGMVKETDSAFFDTKQNNKFVYGSLKEDKQEDGSSKFYILDYLYYRWFEVESETIGQYTGVIDKNKVKIFEGDAIEVVDANSEIVEYSDNFIGIVTYNESSAMFEVEGISESHKGWSWGFGEMEDNDIEILGNIYENPELLTI